MAEKVLAIDYGSKRVGLAIGDGEVKIAHPLSVIKNGLKLFDDLSLISKENQITQLVVGLPRGLDGQETSQTGATRDFVRELESKLGLPVFFQDEALTSQVATDRTIGKKVNSKEPIDDEAAAIILQDYFDTK